MNSTRTGFWDLSGDLMLTVDNKTRKSIRSQFLNIRSKIELLATKILNRMHDSLPVYEHCEDVNTLVQIEAS